MTFSLSFPILPGVSRVLPSSCRIPGKVSSRDEDELRPQSPELHVPADGLKASTSSAEQDGFSSISGPDVHTSSKLGDCDFSREPNAPTHEDKEQTFSRVHTMMILWMVFGLLTMSTIVDDHKVSGPFGAMFTVAYAGPCLIRIVGQGAATVPTIYWISLLWHVDLVLSRHSGESSGVQGPRFSRGACGTTKGTYLTLSFSAAGKPLL